MFSAYARPVAAGADRPPLQREAIVEAARGLIVADGLEALSLRRLAGTLGVTAPALYAHVRDKEDLLRAVAEAEFDQLVARFDAVDEDDPLARIRAHGRAYVEHARERPQLFRVMFLFPPDLSVADAPVERLPGATKAFMAAAGAVEEAVASGALVADDPLLVALTLWSAVHGVAGVLQLGFELPAELEDAMIGEITERILGGYRPAT